MAGGATVASGPSRAVSSPVRVPSSPRAYAPSRIEGLLASRGITGSLERRSSRGRSGASVPFSSQWRRQATPTLTDPSFSTDGHTTGWSINGSSETDRSARWSSSRSGTGGFAERSTSSRAGGDAWRAEARRLAGRTQALSSQLGQVSRASSGDGQNTGTADPSTRSASGARSSSATRDAPDPPAVPIDDHLHWLLGVGLLWGVWRLWSG